MTTTLEFLRALYPDPITPGKLVVWTSNKRSGKKHSFWVNTLGEAASHAHRVRRTRDVYFGVALQDPRKARDIVRQRWPRVRMGSVRGSQDSAVALPAIWVDIDVAGPNHAGIDLPPNRDAALGLLAAVPHEPSILVATGGGFHAYWLFREPWTLVENSERREARDLLRRLQGAIRAEARLEGWAIDDTADLARVLRMPGTFNLKSDPPTPVRVKHFPMRPGTDERRYNPSDFDMLPAVEVQAHADPSRARRAKTPANFEPIMEGCAWLQHCDQDQDRLPEPEWFAMLSIVARCTADGEDGNALGHRLSRGHPGYHPFKTQEKIDHALSGPGPRTCAEIAQAFDNGGRYCGACPHRGQIKSPIVLGRRKAQIELGNGLVTGDSPPGGRGVSPSGAPGASDGPPEIVVTTREHEVNEQALAALAARETNLFERAGLLVHVVRSRCEPEAGDQEMGSHDPGLATVRPIQEARMGELLAQHCVFVKQYATAKGTTLRAVHPPRWAARALLARGVWPQLPRLEGVVECPVLRRDGSVLQTPGYDAASGLVYLPSADFAAVIERPTKRQTVEALAALREIVADFPFHTEGHFAAWLSALLTPLARTAFEGPSPLHLIDANVRGTGKSLLADVCSTLLTGRGAARMSYSGDEDELRKAITGIALEGTSMVLIDNVSGVFGSATLDRALTAETWRDRLLGGNEHVSLPLKVTWLATGNNVSLTGDTPRRCLHVRLESSLERPELRTDFRHPRLLAWVRSERPRLLPAALTLLRGYVAEGKPGLDLPGWGSYEGWSDVVRSAIVWLGLPDPAETREDLETGAGTEQGVLYDLVHGLAEILKPLGGVATSREILERLARAGDDFLQLRSAIGELFPRLTGSELPKATQFAGRMRSYRGRIVQGACIDQASKDYRGVRWTVRQVET